MYPFPSDLLTYPTDALKCWLAVCNDNPLTSSLKFIRATIVRELLKREGQ